MAPIKVPPNLPELVKTAFNRARANGDLTYFPTQVAILDVNSTPFQLRFSPSLANKPKPPKPEAHADAATAAAAARRPPPDPFDNPPAALLIAPLPPSHLLVLNKFAVVPEHFILATARFAPQTHLLAAADLAATRACIAAFAGGGGGPARELFAFFNSGPHSGASQPHRHVQLLPVERMRDGLEDGPPAARWGVLADALVVDGDTGVGGGAAARRALPFVVAVARLREDMDAEALRRVYLELYRRACASAGVELAGEEQEEGEARISYNLAMTRTTMVVCPRVAEGASLMGEDGQMAGSLALNGTVLAGTALVKNQAEWDALRGDPGQLLEVLGKIGIAVKRQEQEVI